MSAKKKQKRAGQGGAVPSLNCIEPNAAGIDVGATEIFVAVTQDRDPSPVRSFETFTQDLHRLKEWLQQCRITTVAMESTGVYWIPLFQILEEAGLEVCLVNAQHVKHVPGRKSDVIDCQMAAVSPLGRAAAGLVSTGGSGLRDSLPAASPRQSGTDGSCARATYAEDPHPDECADPSRAQ